MELILKEYLFPRDVCDSEVKKKAMKLAFPLRYTTKRLHFLP